MILELLVVDFSQTINVFETLHEIVELVDLECFELVAEESVEHFREGFVQVEID